ncbi:MAG: hypothetical protein ABSC90_03620 [Acidimicrobiales bacterium]|jgi:hypothetical protein
MICRTKNHWGHCRFEPSVPSPPASPVSNRPSPSVRTIPPPPARSAYWQRPTTTCGSWPDGSGLGPHDHGATRSVLHVIDGELIEIVADPLTEQPSRARALHRGDAVGARPPVVHDLANRSGTDATSLHVYSPPLAEVTFFNPPHGR